MPHQTLPEHPPSPPPFIHNRKQAQHSQYARAALMNKIPATDENAATRPIDLLSRANSQDSVAREPLPQLPPPAVSFAVAEGEPKNLKPAPCQTVRKYSKDGVGHALSDTPFPSAPNSPRIPPNTRSTSTTSVASTPRIKPTTLDIPGLTKSKVSPDGRIAQRDIGSKLVIVMVGLPARGKSYITKKMARYLNWLQHDARIFNVGERRRLAVNAGTHIPAPGDPSYDIKKLDREHLAAQELLNCCNGEGRNDTCGHPPIPSLVLPEPVHGNGTNGVDSHDYASHHARLEAQFGHLERPSSPDEHAKDAAAMEHTAEFFDPQNKSAAMIRESLAMETLNDLLDY
ncbi:hypothetical protein LTS18_014530, partial [Coniosporium uncinatum]